MSGTETLLDHFEHARHSIFRLERLQHYPGDPNFDRFLRGEPWQDTDSKRHWVDLVSRRTGDGVVMQRVHVVDEPWSDYIRFELTWSYPHNAAAGEDIRITSRQCEAYALAGDFWMLDERTVWAMDYDRAGQLLRAEDRSGQPAYVAACREARAVALAASEPLERVAA